MTQDVPSGKDPLASESDSLANVDATPSGAQQIMTHWQANNDAPVPIWACTMAQVGKSEFVCESSGASHGDTVAFAAEPILYSPVGLIGIRDRALLTRAFPSGRSPAEAYPAFLRHHLPASFSVGHDLPARFFRQI
jgi:hypothetical protein